MGIKEGEIMDRLTMLISKTTGRVLGTDLALQYIYWIYVYGDELKSKLKSSELDDILKQFNGQKNNLSKADIFYIGLIRKQKTTEETQTFAETRNKINSIEKYMNKSDPATIVGIFSLSYNKKNYKNISIIQRNLLPENLFKLIKNYPESHEFAERILIEFTVSVALALYNAGYSVAVLSFIYTRGAEYLLKNAKMKHKRDWENIFEKINEIDSAKITEWINEGIQKGEITTHDLKLKKMTIEEIENLSNSENPIKQYEASMKSAGLKIKDIEKEVFTGLKKLIKPKKGEMQKGEKEVEKIPFEKHPEEPKSVIIASKENYPKTETELKKQV
ncbi:MAG: hypothetical protein KAQ92_08405, partial [Candidatus Aenigmarchaeota archaeon]|nr:hypothetical protein [Candidatus Aenigmarchaeota archaeon]